MPRGAMPVQVLVDPDLLARRRVERHERVVARQHVHHVVDDDRVEDVRDVVRASDRSRPTCELADVGLGDLVSVREVRVVRPAAVVTPRLRFRSAALWNDRGREHCGARRRRNEQEEKTGYGPRNRRLSMRMTPCGGNLARSPWRIRKNNPQKNPAPAARKCSRRRVGRRAKR